MKEEFNDSDSDEEDEEEKKEEQDKKDEISDKDIKKENLTQDAALKLDLEKDGEDADCDEIEKSPEVKSLSKG